MMHETLSYPEAEPTAGVLLIHGLTGTPNEMRHIARGLSRAGFLVHSVKLAGHCGSEADLVATDRHDWFQSVVAAAEMVRREVEHFFVAGLSMGAVLALKYAIEYPRHVRGLGLYGTTFFYDGWSIPAVAKFAFLLPLFQRLGIGRRKVFLEAPPYGLKNERLRQAIVTKMNSGDSSAAGLPGNPWPALAQFYLLSAEVQKNLHRVQAPALVIHARDDDVASLRNAQLIERKARGPVETVVLTNSYHLITLDQEKDVVVARSVDFFRRLIGKRQQEHAPSRGLAETVV